ncbi:MAG: phytanoyl-CoA dioxygenase family protein [Proteobacteria bacterium]|nr:phytanoyl-CoA dioxygenase family protein [Pseudomonadota bacterium]
MSAAFERMLERAGVTALPDDLRDALDCDGYAMLRGVLDAPQCERLRDVFERTYLPSDQWPAPRSTKVRHAMLDKEPDAWAAALHPRVLACAWHLLRQPFVLADVQGRDPKPGAGEQSLHRDWIAPEGPAPMVVVLAFLDPFDAANGATRLIPGTHRLAGGADAYAGFVHHPDEIVVSGAAGDVLVCDGYLVHSGTRNVSGAPRRNLQIDLRACSACEVPKRDIGQAPAGLRMLLGA